MSDFNLNEYIDSKRHLINTALDECLPRSDITPTILHEAMRYSVLSGGKRIRSILCLAVSEAIDSNAVLPLSAAISLELLHAYTLIHDDLPAMDDDDTRRGQPSCHIKFGEANAILAGDALQALAFESLIKTKETTLYSTRDFVAELAAAAGSLGVVGGQVEDIANEETALSEEIIDFVHMHKTADLFRLSVRLGAMSANASPEQLSNISNYGINLGLAFQVTDDILDADITNTKEMNCVNLYGMQRAKDKAITLIDQATAFAEEFKGQGGQALVAIARFVLNRKL